VREVVGCLPLPKVKKAQATAIGGLLFLVIVMLLVGFQLELNQTQVEMSISDAERAEERVEISDVFFGQIKTYTNSSSFPPFTWKANVAAGGNPFTSGGLMAKQEIGIVRPIPNMNFTESANPWVFQRILTNANTGASGSLTTETIDSLSGSSGIFSDFAFNPPPGQTASAKMNWTLSFFVDLTSLGNTVEVATLSIGKKVVKFVNVVGSGEINVYLRNPNGDTYKLINFVVTGEDVNWVHINRAINKNNFTQSGFYTLIVESKAELSRSNVETPEFKVLFDDIGIVLKSTLYVTDWEATFRIDEPVLILKRFMVSIVSRYDVDNVMQSIYIKDHFSNRWDLLDTSFVSTLPTTKTFKFNLAFGPQLQRYIGFGPQLQNITLRIVSIHPNSFKAFSNGISLTDFFIQNRNSLVITIKNLSGKPVTIKSLWISNPSVTKRFELNMLLRGGEEVIRVINFVWTPGDHSFKIVTTKGTVALFSSTA